MNLPQDRRSGIELHSCQGLGQSKTTYPEPSCAENDPIEAIRRKLVAEINAESGSREALERQHGQVWSTEELTRDFEVLGFLSPFVMVRRKSDGTKGSLEFQHSPRFYFNFAED